MGAADGLIRIEWQYEQQLPTYAPRPQPWIVASGFNSGPTFSVNGALRSVDYSAGQNTRDLASHSISQNSLVSSLSASATSAHTGMATMDWAPANDVGITVPGSVSSQRFVAAAPMILEMTKHAIVLQLKGETADNRVVAPVTVKHKPKCVTCGKVNKATSKFCSNCGTSLELV